MLLIERIVGHRHGPARPCGIVVAIVSAVVACDGSHARPSVPVDAPLLPVLVEPITDLTLVLVVDDSPEAVEERTALADATPELMRTLLATPPRPERIRVAVISSDIGTFGQVIDGCPGAVEGDAAALRTAGDPARAECAISIPAPLIVDSETDVAAAGQQIGCLITGTAPGCPYQQPLETLLWAMLPADAEIRWLRFMVGKGDTANASLFGDTLVAVLVASARDDCSALIPELYWNDMPGFEGAPDARCANPDYDDALQPVVDRYQHWLPETSKRSGVPMRFSVLVGVPDDAPLDDLDALLRHPGMVGGLDETGSAPRIACTTAARGDASAGRRMVQAMQAVDGTVGSICAPDLSLELERLASPWLAGRDPCLPEEWISIAADCDLVEMPLDGMSCASLPGRSPAGGRCLLTKRDGPDDGPGWILDTASPETRAECAHRTLPARARLVGGASRQPGSRYALACPSIPCTSTEDCHATDRSLACRPSGQCASVCRFGECAEGASCTGRSLGGFAVCEEE